MKGLRDCKSCQFMVESYDHACFRFPAFVEIPTGRWKDDRFRWCGEWRGDSEKMCQAKGEEVYPGYKSKSGTFDIPAMYVRCCLPKEHEGDHTDGIRTWRR